MATTHDSAEAVKNKPKALEALDSIERQESQSALEGMQVVQATAGEVQGEVADIMGGMEKPSETIGETGEKRDIGTRGGAVASDDDDDDDQQVTIAGVGQVKFPPQPLMVKKVVKAIRKEIKVEMKHAAKLEKKLATGNAKDYNESIAKIRSLKSNLKSALNATVDFLKELYVRFVVNPKNHRSAGVKQAS